MDVLINRRCCNEKRRYRGIYLRDKEKKPVRFVKQFSQYFRLSDGPIRVFAGHREKVSRPVISLILKTYIENTDHVSREEDAARNAKLLIDRLGKYRKAYAIPVRNPLKSQRIFVAGSTDT